MNGYFSPTSFLPPDLFTTTKGAIVGKPMMFSARWLSIRSVGKWALTRANPCRAFRGDRELNWTLSSQSVIVIEQAFIGPVTTVTQTE